MIVNAKYENNFKFFIILILLKYKSDMKKNFEINDPTTYSSPNGPESLYPCDVCTLKPNISLPLKNCI